MNNFSVLALLIVLTNAVSGQEINALDGEGRKHGLWEKKWDNGVKRYRGRFDHGKQVGKFIYYFQTGDVSAVTNFQSAGVAYTKMYFPTKQLMAKGKFIDQQKDSTWLCYNERGHLIAVEQWEKGVKHGKWVSYYPGGMGKKSDEKIFIKGLLNGEWNQYFVTGKLKMKAKYRNGNIDGWVFHYYPDGTKREQGFYRHAVRNGYWKFYDKDGNLENKAYYLNGKELKDKALKAHLDKIKNEHNPKE